jgi:hypothetical protein
MNTCKRYSKVWFLVLLLIAFVTGCGSNSSTGGGNAGGNQDTTAPTVSSTNAANGATGVAVNAAITATFSEAMTPSTVNAASFSLNNGVTGAVTYAGTIATFTPAGSLAYSTSYTATISTGVQDAAGNVMAAAYTWTFTTGMVPDTTAPAVISTVPLDGSAGVALNSSVNAVFSEVMSAATLTNSTFTLMQGSTPVSGTVTYLGTRATFKPASDLDSGMTYTATITTRVTDLAGNALAVNKIWSFITGTTTAAGPAPVLLGAAGNYVILAESGVSTVPASVITGDVGLSPAATTYLTGFSITMVGTTAASSPQVTGSLYAADMSPPTSSNLTTAITDMGTAYTDAAGRPTPDILNLGAGEIGGQTLIPGLYKWTTGVTISADVTISGGPNDVWIFQIPGNLTIGAAKNVFLSGGAKAGNIFWQVAGAVDIGTTAHFEGIILSQTAITMETGASMNGRALAQTAVNLDQSTVMMPAP